MLLRISALTLAVALALGSDVRPASASPANDPIDVASCSLDQYRLSLDVDFSNTSAKSVGTVRFALTTASGIVGYIDDAGAFQPGEAVKHHLRVDQKLFMLWADVGCAAAAVTFADGSTWQNPSVPSDMEHALEQTAGSQIVLSRCLVADGFYVSYRNTANQSATQVDFGLVEDGLVVLRATDKGTFGPNTLIQRMYFGNSVSGNAINEDALHERCIVLDVHYADGTVWTNQSPPPFSPQGVPLDAESGGEDAPVTVVSCDGTTGRGNFGSWRITYRNASQKAIAATDIAFVEKGTIAGAGRDLHALAPGDATKRNFGLDPSVNVFQPVCVPLRVKYADGTTWMNPQLHS